MMDQTKILVVEDEPKVAAFIKQGLEEVGFKIDVAYDGITGKSMLLTNKYHVIILDVNLPLINGFQLCKLARESSITSPVLMLTALGGIEDKLQGFDSGADDYLLKPFEVRELVARIKVLLKRGSEPSQEEELIRIADLEIDTGGKRVTRGGEHISLRAKEYNLLVYMARNRGKILDRLQICEAVWGINFDTGTNVIDVYINSLRKKLDADYEPKLFHTKIGLGYILTDKAE